MIQKIELITGQTAYLCDICGHASAVIDSRCGIVPPLQRTNLVVGSCVAIWWHSGRWIRHGLWTVKNLRYAGPGWDGCVRGTQLPLHTLIIEVAQNGSNQPWRPGDWSCQSTELAYPDFLLWQMGDEDALRAAGCINPLTTTEQIMKKLGRLPSLKRP